MGEVREGAHFSFPVLDLSPSGFSFSLDEPLPGIEVGSSIDGVTVSYGKLILQGDLMVMHVTPQHSVCGVLFYPASDMDLIKLKCFVAGLQAAGPS